MRRVFKFSIILLSIFILGCATIKEAGQSFWGSSTRDLAKARRHALSQSYACELAQCFEEVLKLKRTAPAPKLATEVDTGTFDVFIQDRDKRYLVVMGIRGNVDTTEVGIFFDKDSSGGTKIDVASLSDSAKRKVAEAIFNALSEKFLTKGDTNG